MKTISLSFVRKAFNDQRGQMLLPMVALTMVGLLTLGGLTIDIGRAYVVRSEIQNTVNAAALAAVGQVYNTSPTTGAVAVGNNYASLNSSIPGAVTSIAVVTPICLKVLQNGASCSGAPNNAVQVTQSATVSTYFMRLFNIPTLTVGATATAAPQGPAQPWNVAIILDATPSMNNTDPYCTNHTSYTSEQCALFGIQTMLKGINPCRGGLTGSNCATSSPSANFRVSLFSFPNVTTTTVVADYCAGGTPTETLYTLPQPPPSTGALATAGYVPIKYSGASSFTATYQITPPGVGNADANGFLSDYFLPSGTNGFNSTSILVKAVGNGSTNGCLKPPTGFSGGGGQTYFASAIYAAQAALQAEQKYVTGLGITSNNAIIFVSDGQANTPDSNRFPQATSTATTAGSAGVGGYTVSTNGTSTYSSTARNLLNAVAGTWGTYPDFNDACQQAIMAAQFAAKAGTRFYAVGYGSELNGCTEDTHLVVTGTLNVPITSINQVIPCMVMQDMASVNAVASSTYFYTDGSSAKNGCSAGGTSTTDLDSIFGAITATFTGARLLPNNAS